MEVIQTSRGWIEKFKKRIGIHSIICYGETPTSDAKAAEAFVGEFKKLMDEEGYLPLQVFNYAETVVFWKKMSERIFITVEEMKMPRSQACER